MKKCMGIALAVLLVVGFSGVVTAEQLTDSHTFNFDVEVERYIDVGTQLDFTLPPISPPGGGDFPPPISYSLTQYEVAYANCPFRIDYAGDNDVPDGLPILARLELGAASSGYDRLQTRLEFHTIVNGAWNGAVFGAGWAGDGTGTPNIWAWGRDYVVMNETPHDGEVGLALKCGVGLPHVTPEFGVDNIWSESADAGQYRCWVVATYSAL